MKTFSRLALAVVALFVSAALATAATSGVVNKLEVQKLVAAGTPEANLALAGHFAALAERYAAEAVRHTDMAKAYNIHSSRQPASGGASAHCERLATLANESAATARDMAAYHEQLASGLTPTAPKDAAKFQAGEGAPEPTETDVHHLAMMARTPADHRLLEEYFTSVANKKTADAEAHTAMARAYRAGVWKGLVDPAAHCDRLAKLARDAAKEATDAASLHRQLATIG